MKKVLFLFLLLLMMSCDQEEVDQSPSFVTTVDGQETVFDLSESYMLFDQVLGNRELHLVGTATVGGVADYIGFYIVNYDVQSPPKNSVIAKSYFADPAQSACTAVGPYTFCDRGIVYFGTTNMEGSIQITACDGERVSGSFSMLAVHDEEEYVVEMNFQDVPYTLRD